MTTNDLLYALLGLELPETDPESKETEREVFLTPELRDAARQVRDDILSTLTPLEKEMLHLRFNLDGRGLKSHREVAKYFMRSESWAKETENRAFAKLRHPSRSRRLREFLEQLEASKQDEPRSENEPSLADLKDVITTVKELTPELIIYLQSHEKDLEKVPPRIFEQLVAEFLAQRGFQDVRLVGKTYKTSADIYAVEKVNSVGIAIKYYIEVKREKERIGIDVIDQVYGAMIGEKSKFGWHAAMIVSVSGFKHIRKYEEKEIEMKGVYLKDRNEIRKWLEEYRTNKGVLWLRDPDRSLSI